MNDFLKKDSAKYLLCLLFFIVLALITFRCCWPADHVFSASDLNIGRLAFKKHYLPESLIGYFSANQVMGSSGAQFNLFHVLLALMPLEMFANSFYGMVLILGSMSAVWFLRIWNRSWLASVFGALVAFWFNSIILASTGHAYKMEVLALSMLSLGFIEKAIRSGPLRRSVAYSILAGLSVGIMMMEQQDVALLAGLFIGPYALFRLIQHRGKDAMRWVSVLVPIAVVSLVLSGSTLIASYKYNIAGAASVQKGEGASGSNEKWNFITQWSMVPSEWPDLIAPGWSGWATGDQQGPYWGKVGQSADWEKTRQGFQNFRLDSLYVGIVPFLFAGFAMWYSFIVRKDEESKVIWFWSIAAFVGLLLAFGKYSPLYKLFFQLPLVSNIRAPIKFLDNFQICLAILSAFGLDQLLKVPVGGRRSRLFGIISVSIGGLSLLGGIKVLVASGALEKKVSAMGLGQLSETIIQNAMNAWFHAAVLSVLCGVLVFLAWKGIVKSQWVMVAFVLVLSVDSLMLTSHYFKATDIGALKKGNVLINYLKQNQGDDRTAFVDQGGIYNQWLASDGPFHGLNLFNIWQMPRMPSEYKEYLGKVGRNQIRLWQLSAVSHMAAPKQVYQQLQSNKELGKYFIPVLDYQVPTAQGMRQDVLLEYSGSIPRFALYQNWESISLKEHCAKLASPAHNPRTTVLVDLNSSIESSFGNEDFNPVSAKVTNRKAIVDVNATEPSILRFSQRYQNNWSVLVDGMPAELLRLDYISMGVMVPLGQHEIEFICVTKKGRLLSVTVIFFISMILAFWLIKDLRKELPPVG